MIGLTITGMTCGSCAAHVTEALEKVPGVRSAVVSHSDGTARIDAAPGTSPEACGHLRTRLPRHARRGK